MDSWQNESEEGTIEEDFSEGRCEEGIG